MLAGFMVHPSDPKQVVWGTGVWVIYGAILSVDLWRRVSPRRVAQLSVAAFSLTLATLWGLTFINPGGSM
jgi:hypothetical protein